MTDACSTHEREEKIIQREKNYIHLTGFYEHGNKPSGNIKQW